VEGGLNKGLNFDYVMISNVEMCDSLEDVRGAEDVIKGLRV